MNITRFNSVLIRKGWTAQIYQNCFKIGRRVGNVQLLDKTIKYTSQMCCISTYQVEPRKTLFKKILSKIPFMNVNKTRIKGAAYLLYEEVADKVNYINFFEKCNLPDTFYSWFVVTELHIWMLSVRAMAEGEEGRYLRNCLIEALWADVALRVKKLGAGNPAGMRAQVSELSEQFQAALISYDEGLNSDDVVLAGALWRRFYQMEEAYPVELEQLVTYVRKHISLLDNMSSDQLFKDKSIHWDPIGKYS